MVLNGRHYATNDRPAHALKNSLLEGQRLIGGTTVGLDVAPLLVAEARHGGAQPGVGEMMQRTQPPGGEPSRQLVLALGTGIEAGQPLARQCSMPW